MLGYLGPWTIAPRLAELCEDPRVSPFGRPKPPGPGEEEGRAAEADLERIRQGGIPLGTEQRFKRLSTSSTPFFTSDLTAKEYALAQASGLTPIAQVMGSSVVQHSLLANQGVSLANRGLNFANERLNLDNQSGSLANRGLSFANERLNLGNQGLNLGNQSSSFANQNLYYTSGEIPALAEPWNLARDRAFYRLGLEASLAGADAVIGIEMNTGSVSESGHHEVVVFGTAVRDSTLSPGEAPWLGMCTLSGQDVDKLRRVGAAARGVVGHTTVYSVQLGRDSEWVMNSGGLFGGGARANTEITEIAQGIYDARDRAMLEVRRQANEVGANGVVISMLRHTIEHYEYEQSDYKYHYFHVTMNVLGTAIEIGATKPHPARLSKPMMSINLGS
jgi:uncharacterized protein YbjQ (UPF0145 family)